MRKPKKTCLIPVLLATLVVLLLLLLVGWVDNLDLRDLERGLPDVRREWEAVRSGGEEQLQALREGIGRRAEAHLRRRHRRKKGPGQQ